MSELTPELWEQIKEEAEIDFHVFPEYDRAQCLEMRIGFHTLPNEEFFVYFNPELPASLMREIRLGLEHGISEKTMKKYVSPDFSANQMREICLGLEHGLSKEEIAVYANADKYDEHSMAAMREALEAGIPSKFVTKLMDEQGISGIRCQKDNILIGMEQGLSDDRIMFYINFGKEQALAICDAMEAGISDKMIKMCADPRLSGEKMGLIFTGVWDGLITEDNAEETIEKLVGSKVTASMARDIIERLKYKSLDELLAARSLLQWGVRRAFFSYLPTFNHINK